MDVNPFILIVNQISILNFFLLVWFHTEAFVEYIKVFKLGHLFRVNKYLEYKNVNPSITYIEFLTIKNPNFFTKLFSCGYCLSFWLTLLSCLLFNNLILFFIIYMISIVIYNILRRYIYE